MRILLVHNFYQQPGGEDSVFQAEKNLLKEYGHEVRVYTDDNDRLEGMGRFTALRNTLWSTYSHNKMIKLLSEFQPDVVHCHNVFPLISPSVYYACTSRGIPVVQTLHNYRLLCPNALFFREGKVCESCLGKKLLLPAILHGCYRDSRIQSSAVALMLSVHRFINTWEQQVTAYIALTEFAREKFIAGGLPAEKLVVKPNFIADPLNGQTIPDNSREGALFVGRLSEEKGIRTLLQAFKALPEVKLTIAGDGPLKDVVVQAAQAFPNIRYAGRLTKAEVLRHMLEAGFLVFPSECYETFGIVAIEAFACGLPVIASRLGAMAEIVEDGKTGLHFTPGNAGELAEKVRWANAHREEMAQMGQNARREYEEKYTAEKNYRMLMEIYESAIAERKAVISGQRLEVSDQ